ncbi:MAG: phage holin family protein [Elusimicrobia bacterium]|nr:phage holin family protein [Elusimicrobiota bacterium]
MKEIFAKLIVNVISMMLVVAMFSHIHADRWETVVIAAVVLGLMNIILRPVIIMLTLPINIISLGLFTFVINGLMFYLVSVLVPGFKVDGFIWAVIGSTIFGVINVVLNWFFVPKKQKWHNVSFHANHGDIIDADVVDPDKKLID